MAIDSIIKWASKLPGWQQDALRRVALSSELSDKDTSMILANLMRSVDMLLAGEKALQPLKKEHLRSDARNAPLAHLCSIDKVKNANRLAPDQKLSFAINGITLVYGHNGSGKSGYCRVLKKYFHADIKEPIYPNVFEAEKFPPAEARIRYKLDGKEEVSENTWQDGRDGASDNVHLSVFDSHNARIYVDDRNRLDYLPYEIEFLKRFSKLLMSLKEDHLTAKIKEVDKRLNVRLPSGYTQETLVCELVSRLTQKTTLVELPTIEDINALAKWTDENTQDLEKLQKTIVSDPKARSIRCRRVQYVVSGLIDELTKATDALTQNKARELEQAVKHARTTDEIASLAAEKSFKDQPLRHVGSDSWHLMFQHAKEYSKLAYPGIEPPATGEGDLCVLCQQPLAEEAADRLRRFEYYVAGEAKKAAKKAEKIRDEKTTTIKTIQIRSVDDAKSQIGEYASMSDTREQIAAEVVTFIKSAHKCREKLLAAVDTGDFSEFAELDGSLINKLHAEKNALADEAVTLDDTVRKYPDWEKRKKELNLLQDRKLLSENLETTLARRNDLELRTKLEDCINGVKTNAVSHQISVLRKELVTEDLNNRIRNEIMKLDLEHIPLQIDEYSQKGESHYTVTLKAQQKVTNRDVLSEGEQRGLGLACFLADVNGQPVKHGIIVDDPVSSLDHVRIGLVATRLVDEAAAGRQVIVFTHNLLFFSDVISSAAAHTPNQVKVKTNFIRKKEPLGFGVIMEDGEPWEAMKTTERIDYLRKQIEKLNAISDKDGDTYHKAVKEFYTQLRETWERLVEEVLLCEVVKRYGYEVKTQTLKRVVVDDADYKIIYCAMKSASKLSGHDMPEAKNQPPPKIVDLENECDKLKNYYKKLRHRSNRVENDRKKLEQPPKATTA